MSESISEKCYMCGEMKPREGETFNGQPLCKECVAYMKGER